MKELLKNIGITLLAGIIFVGLFFICCAIEKHIAENPQPCWMGRYNPP